MEAIISTAYDGKLRRLFSRTCAHCGDPFLAPRRRGHRCEKCGLSEWLGQPIALDVHHIDGNATNDADANAQLLCCNCHAQTPNWRGRNLGHGRKSRK